MISLTRRHFLTGSAACGLATLTRRRLAVADSTRLLTIAFGWVPNAEYADIFVGMEKQHFANAGLSIKYLGGGTSRYRRNELVAVAGRRSPWQRFRHYRLDGSDDSRRPHFAAAAARLEACRSPRHPLLGAGTGRARCARRRVQDQSSCARTPLYSGGLFARRAAGGRGRCLFLLRPQSARDFRGHESQAGQGLFCRAHGPVWLSCSFAVVGGGTEKAYGGALDLGRISARPVARLHRQ